MAKKLMIFGIIGLLLIGGCSKKEVSQKAIMPDESPAEAPAFRKLEKEELGSRANVESKRYIAIRHHLVVETTESELPKTWESVNEFCISIGCDILESSINKKTPYTTPSGTLVLRVVPKDLNRLLEHINKVGNIVSHTTQSEDKTSDVIDVEAKIKNLTELRNRLRSILATRTGSLKDVVEVERELSRAQAELDSLVAKRKALANETDKVAVSIEFRSEPSIVETGAFAPIVSAWHEIGHVFASSIAVAITFIVAVVPWLILIVPGIWFLPKLIRKLLRKQTH